MPELRRDHRVRAPSLESSAKHLLAPTLSVDVRGVEEVDAVVERRVDDSGRSGCVEPPSEVVAPDADDANLQQATDLTFLRVAHVRQSTQRRLLRLLEGW